MKTGWIRGGPKNGSQNEGEKKQPAGVLGNCNICGLKISAQKMAYKIKSV